MNGAGITLRTRQDMERTLTALLDPLVPRMSEGRALLRLGDSGAVYPGRIADMEAWSRPLWAIFPLLAAGGDAGHRYWELWSQGLKNGTDPDHPEFWGWIGDSDQRMVECAAIGFGMALTPERFWEPFSEMERERVLRWLDGINRHDMPRNNWRFFRLLVNIGLDASGLEYSRGALEEDIALLEEHYEADGWYFDAPAQRDYYTPWEFHFDGLLCAVLGRCIGDKQRNVYIERAKQFAPRFAAWFDVAGEALAYGRSLTYRFAQGSFFGALAFAGADTAAVGYGEMKHLLLGNLRRWLSRPIFRRDGTLSIGYGYPNLLMADEYNAPGSPYWGMKAFLPLALPEDHPFWQTEEREMNVPERFVEEHSRMLLVRNGRGTHVQAFQGGNHCPGHAHGEAKYEKFVYSTLFSFSVPRGLMGLAQGAFDSVLAVSDDGLYWRPRFGCDSWDMDARKLSSTWSPYQDVTIETELIPVSDWHIRVHHIRNGRPLQAADGGFAIAREVGTEELLKILREGAGILGHASWGTSGILSLSGWESAEAVYASPDTNLMYQRTVIPTLRASLEPGEHTLVSAVLGSDAEGDSLWDNPPEWQGRS